MSELKLRLTLNIAFRNADREDQAALTEQLEYFVQQAAGEGLLTGHRLRAEVESYTCRVDLAGASAPDVPTEDQITRFIQQQVDDGNFDLEGMARRAARYGLASPAQFLSEMQERIEMTRSQT